MDSDKIQKKIEKIEEKANQQVDNLAREYFDQVVVPFCKKYSLTFTSGMGLLAFSFDEYDLMFHAASDIPDAEDIAEIHEEDLCGYEKFALKFPGAKKEMEEIYKVIYLVVFEFELGFSMPCYNPRVII
jgi:hypothetical protein